MRGAAHRAVAGHAADPAAPLRAAAAGAGRRTSLPARRHRAGVVRRRLGGVRRPARLPAGRSAQAHSLAELGAHRAAGGARVPGRVLRAPRPRARHVPVRADPGVRGGRVGGGLVRVLGRHPGIAARPALRRRRSALRSPRGAVSVTWIGCSRSWPRCGRAATGPSPRCRDSCWSTSVRSRAPCWCSWPGTRRVASWSIACAPRGVPTRVLLVTDGSVVRHPARRAPRHGRSRGRRPPAALMRSPLLGIALVFWGWQTGLLPVGLAMAVALEARMLTRSRWDLSRHDFNRVSDLSAILLVGMAIYEVVANEMARAVTGIIQWLPMVTFPVIACQVYSAVGRVEMAVFFWSHAPASGGRADGRPDPRVLRPVSALGQHRERAVDLLRWAGGDRGLGAVARARTDRRAALGRRPRAGRRARVARATSAWPRRSVRSSAARPCGWSAGCAATSTPSATRPRWASWARSSSPTAWWPGSRPPHR